jgi:hypothetical protein
MKSIVLIAIILSIPHPLIAQGELFFATRNPAAGVNAPGMLRYPDGSTTGLGPSWSADLALNGVAVPGSRTTFQPPGTGGAAILDRYIVPVTVQFSGHGVGEPVSVQMRVWQTAAGSYENAILSAGYAGTSGPLSITLGGGTLPPADLPSSFTGFVLDVPEPSTAALALFSSLFLLRFLRKQTQSGNEHSN